MTHGNLQYAPLAPRSKFYRGPFGRLFPELPAWQPPGASDKERDNYLFAIANSMVEKPGELPSDIATSPATIMELENKFSSVIPAGYTYFGQFIDHDITFDPTSSLMRQNDPNGLLNFRTPRLDLDSIYGAGRLEQPYLYEQNDNIPNYEAKLAVGHVEGIEGLPDLPRYKEIALIGDKRNDENSIISQLQVAFLLAHNNLVDRAHKESPNLSIQEKFERARRTLQWLYQYIVWKDFVRRITISSVYENALRLENAGGGRKRWVCGLEDIYNWKHQPFMPVEFSVAAYRFGHSMVRNSYRTHHPDSGEAYFIPIFNNSPDLWQIDDLRGLRPLKVENCIQWDWFLPMGASTEEFPQRARKIDPFLANALAFLFEEKKGNKLNVLAFRNLKRGVALNLPSGTDVAKRLGIKPIKLKDGEPDALWYYLLREAGDSGGNKLGQVGSIIVCSVFSGLLKGDPHSFLSMQPCWEPDNEPLLQEGNLNRDDKSWALSSIIRLAGIKANGIGFE